MNERRLEVKFYFNANNNDKGWKCTAFYALFCICLPLSYIIDIYKMHLYMEKKSRQDDSSKKTKATITTQSLC